MKEIFSEIVQCFGNGAFTRQFRWNLPYLIPGYMNSDKGYLVQHVCRKTQDNVNRFLQNDTYNHKYWEAWPVEKGQIALEAELGFDDNWSLLPMDYKIKKRIGRIDGLLQMFEEHKNTIGEINMHGEVYWAPHNSEMWKIVEDNFHSGCVKWAGDLKSAKTINLPEGISSIFSHEFDSRWNLFESKTYIRSVVDCLRSFLFSTYSNNEWTDTKKEFLESVHSRIAEKCIIDEIDCMVEKEFG